MSLEDTYSAYGDQIRAARQAGFTDSEIQSEFQSLIQEQSRAGIPVEQITRGISRSREPKGLMGHITNAIGGPLEAAASIATVIPESMISQIPAGLSGLVKMATEAPRAIAERGLSEGLATAAERAAPTVERTREAIAPYLRYRPQTEFGEALVEPVEKVLSLPEEAAQFYSDIAHEKTGSSAAAATVNTLANFFLDPTNLIFAPAVFKSVKGRAPKGPAEIMKTAREDPAFVKEIQSAQQNLSPEIAQRIEGGEENGLHAARDRRRACRAGPRNAQRGDPAPWPRTLSNRSTARYLTRRAHFGTNRPAQAPGCSAATRDTRITVIR